VTGKHIHGDPYLNLPSQILFDIDDATLNLMAVTSGLSPIHPRLPGFRCPTFWRSSRKERLISMFTQLISRLVKSTGILPGQRRPDLFSTPTPPAFSDDHSDPAAAARFLIQATFGPSSGEVASVPNRRLRNLD
jgi:hypothetical protein